MYSVARSPVPGCAGFRQVVATFLSQPGLPFAHVLSEERIERIFSKHGNLFGVSAVYSTAVTISSHATVIHKLDSVIRS